MIGFRSYVDRDTFVSEPTPAGDEFLQRFQRVDDPNKPGSWSLVKTDSVRIQDMINSARPPLITDIVKRAMRGDLSLLSANGDSKVFLDVSALQNQGPDTLYDIVSRGRSEAGKIPVETFSESEVKPNADAE